MKLSKQILKNSMEGIKIVGTIGLCSAFLIGGFLQNNLYATTIVPVSYDVSTLTSTLYRKVPEGYVKPNYKVEVDSYSDPITANELSSNEIAEIISQEFYRFFKSNLSGKTLSMIHITEDNYYPYWVSSVDIDANTYLGIRVNGITGEIFSIHKDFNNPTHLISNPSKNIEELEKQADALAAPIIKKIDNTAKANSQKILELISASGFISEPIESVTYNGCNKGVNCVQPQGITLYPHFKVVSTSGNVYLITLSEDLSEVNGFQNLSDSMIVAQ